MWTNLLENEICKLEKQLNSYSICAKLADLYIIKDHCCKKNDFLIAYENFANHKDSEHLIEFLKKLKEMLMLEKQDFPKEIENFINNLITSKVDLEIKK